MLRQFGILLALRPLGDFGDQADDDGAAADDAEEFSDGGARVLPGAAGIKPTVTCAPLTASTRPSVSRAGARACGGRRAGLAASLRSRRMPVDGRLGRTA